MTLALKYWILLTTSIVCISRSLPGQVINLTTKISIANSGKKTTEKTVVLQINNKQENKRAEISIGHNPRQKFDFSYAHVIDPSGKTVKKLKKKDLVTRSSFSNVAFYQDDLVTEFDLYWSQFPYQIEYSYTITEDEFLNVAWWTPLLYTGTGTLNSTLEVNVPSDYKLHIQSHQAKGYEKLEEDNRVTHLWNMTDVKSPPRETMSSPFGDLIPKVVITPYNFDFGIKGSTQDWASFGSWVDGLNKGTDELPDSEKLIVKKLVENLESQEEKIKAVYQYLQDHTKYIYVGIEHGGLQSYPASYVCENKYGDCKALTTYMKAMLSSIGIESYYTIIKAGKDQKSIDTNHTNQQFNHVILSVPTSKETYWLENTANYLPFNYLGTFTQDRSCLQVNGETSKLIRTPSLTADQVLTQREINIQLKENSEAIINADITTRGEAFEAIRHSLSHSNEESQNKKLKNQIELKNFEVESSSFTETHRDSSFVMSKISGTSPSLIRTIGSIKTISPLNISIPRFEEPKERTLDVQVSYPINRLDISKYDLSLFGTINIQIPNGVSIENNFGSYTTDYHESGKLVTITEQFILYAQDVSIDDYESFYLFLDTVIEHKKASAIIIK